MKRRIPKSPKEREKVVRELLSLSQKSESEIFFELGRILISECGTGGYFEYPTIRTRYRIKAMRRDFGSFGSIGKKFWPALRKKLYQLFCDRANKTPKAWVKELMGGELRNAGIALLVKVTKACDVSVAVAIPIVALILKKGISTFCSHPPK